MQNDSLGTRIQLPFETDEGLGFRARIGFIVLSGDQTIEYEMRKLLDVQGVAIYTSRVFNPSVVTAENLAKMEGRIIEAARLINTVWPPHVVAFGCTSGAMVIGEKKVAEKIKEAWPQAEITDPMTSAFAALDALGARRIALLSPYPAEMTTKMSEYLSRRYEIPIVGEFSQEGVNIVAAAPFITAECVEKAIREVTRSTAVDAVFVACTSMRIAEAIEGVEQRLGVPITSANHALCWHALRLGGINDPVEGFGRLFRTPLSTSLPSVASGPRAHAAP